MDPVCIVGAGPAGLAAGAALEARGIPFRIFDAGRGPGGIWDMERADSPMYASAHFISSKTLSGFPGFPMPDAYPDYPSHAQILAYVRAFSDHHRLGEDTTFGVRVTRARPATGARSGAGDAAVPAEGDAAPVSGGPSWEVTWEPVDAPDDTRTGRFSALIVAVGSTWHPNVPELPGPFDGEVRHSVSYRAPDELRDRRVLVVGGGNSAVDIACDAARSAERALLSLRRGYHFIPKYVLGTPSDVFAHAGPTLPAWLERRVFGFLVRRLLVGDPTRYGLPEPDHPILASHPIMNTEVLHHLGHGRLEARPDVARLDGDGVVFADGRRDPVDLVLLATGYRRRFSFLELGPETEGPEGPAVEEGEPLPPEDLLLNLLHRRLATLFVMGHFETDGAAYPLFGAQAELVARAVEVEGEGGAAAKRLARLRREARPDLRGGRRYVDSPRHRYYVADAAYRKALAGVRRALEG